MDSDNKDKDKKRILAALETKPLLTEELLEALGYEPGGGELVFPIRELMEEGEIMREKVRVEGLVPKVDTFRYSLMNMTGRKWVGLDEPMGNCQCCIHKEECAPLKERVQEEHLNGNYRFRCPILIKVDENIEYSKEPERRLE